MAEIVNQVVMQAATVVMMTFRDTETGPHPATTPNQWDSQRQRNGGLMVESQDSIGACQISMLNCYIFNLK